MMEYQDQLKVQAYLDGELSEAEAREVANRLARDQGAIALMNELRHTRQAVSGFESGFRVPESREFYWSKIQRAIERLEPKPEQKPEAIPFILRLRRLLVPTTALAAAALVALMVVRGGAPLTGETSLEDTGAFTYHDYSAGATLVWLSYPADDPANDFEDPSAFD
jgi:anti-sigma factor RsiW